MTTLPWKQIARFGSFFTHKFAFKPVLQNQINNETELTKLKLPELVNALQTMPSNDAQRLLFDGLHRARILEHANHQIQKNDNHTSHQALAAIYKTYFTQTGTGRGASFLLNDLSYMLEERLLDDVDKLIESRFNKLLPEMPVQSSKLFIRWLLKIIQTHPASTHSFYTHFIRKKATRNDLRFWLAQESTLDQRFDDVLATLQIGTNGTVKMEVAKNYWDEMGNGDLNKMHTRLFSELLDELEVTPSYIAATILPASLLTGNLSSCLSLHRHLFYEALGFFGVVEYLAPSRFTHVLSALQRNGVSEQGQAYHKLHIWIDRIHGASWFNDVVRSVVEEKPESAKSILRGVLARLETSVLHLDAFPTPLSFVVNKDEMF